MILMTLIQRTQIKNLYGGQLGALIIHFTRQVIYLHKGEQTGMQIIEAEIILPRRDMKIMNVGLCRLTFIIVDHIHSSSQSKIYVLSNRSNR